MTVASDKSEGFEEGSHRSTLFYFSISNFRMSGKFQIKGNLASLLKFPILTSAQVHLARRGCKLHRGGGLRVENTTRIGSVVVVVGLSSTSTQVHLAPWGEGESQEGGTGGQGRQVTEPAKCNSVLI